ncbi:DNA repair protein [Trichophyton mentagrophytes]|nr:DNA repair protein [Trichophyton mentagrophytes]
MDTNPPENNVYNDDIVFNEDLEFLAPLFQSEASAGENQVTGDVSPISKPLDVIDSEALSLTRVSDNPVAKYSNSENGEEGEGLKNYSGDMWVELEKELDSSELEEYSQFEEAKAAFEAEKNPSLESQIRFEKAKAKEYLRISREKQRKALIQQERNTHHDCIDGNETEEVKISKTQGGESQKLGQENDFDLFYPENNAAPAEELHRCNSPSNEESIPVFVWERTQKSKESTKPKGRPRQNGASKKVRKTNDKVKETKKRNTTRGRSSNGSTKFKKNSTNKGPTHLNFDSLFTSNLIENAKRNTKKTAIPKFTSGNKKEAMKEIMASIPTDDDIDMRTMSQHKKAIMESVTKFTIRPRLGREGGWKQRNMTTNLFHYQLLGVGFMRDRENSPAAPRGGFLCDEMGFGKTIQAIANMVDGMAVGKEPTTTLIVAPTHLIEHWKDELLKHVEKGKLGRIFVYHGAQKLDTKLAIESGGTKDIGVIITTYSEIRASCRFPVPEFTNKEDETKWKLDKCGFLHNFMFRRIYLDEAHEIKNHNSKASQAVRLLTAKFRWVITGTPIHNDVTEFYSYFNFLKVPGLENYYTFLDKIVNQDPDHRRLTNCLRAYMLRRTHAETLFGRPILKLPDIDENTVVVEFSIVERALYQKLIGSFLDEHLSTMRSIDGIDNYLTLLLYLRMFTSHLLLPQDVIKQILTPQFMQEIEPEVKQSSNKEDIEIFKSLQVLWFENKTEPLGGSGKEKSDAGFSTLFESVMGGSKGATNIMDCIECHQRKESVFVLSCMHLCCFDCIPKLRQAGDKQIICRCGLTVSCERCLDLQKFCGSKAIRRARSSKSRCIDEFEQDKGVPTISETVLSAKLRAVKLFVSKWLKESPNIKITIFTQFLGMIGAISSICEAEGWRYTTLCGKLHHRTRHANIKRFREENVSILISSLKAGGVGLNLTMASKCILVDLWWNEAIEQQAFCRLFRIGQKNDVEIVRICVENTVDDRLQLIQSRKSEHIRKAMGDTLADVLTLFGVEEDGNADGGYRFLTEEEAAAQLKEKDKSPDDSAEAEAEADPEVRPEPEPEPKLEPEPEPEPEPEINAEAEAEADTS